MMRDKHDIRGRADWNSDGITGYTQGANARASWISENTGKLVIGIILFIIIGGIATVLMTDTGDDQPVAPVQQQQQAGER